MGASVSSFMSLSVLRSRLSCNASGALQRATGPALGSKAIVLSGAASSGKAGDEDDFLAMVTGARVGFSSANANQLTAKCAGTPQLALHLSQMLQEPTLADPVLDSVTLKTFQPTRNLHWPRRGGL